MHLVSVAVLLGGLLSVDGSRNGNRYGYGVYSNTQTQNGDQKVMVEDASAETTSSASAEIIPSQISTSLFSDLESLARLVDVSYCLTCVGPAGPGLGISKPFRCVGRCREFSGMQLVETFCSGLTGGDGGGFLAVEHKGDAEESTGRIVVAFRGTYSLANTIADLSSIPQEYVSYPDLPGESEREGKKKHHFSDWFPWPFKPRSCHSSSEEYLGDINEPQTRPCPNCTVHSGFYTTWLAVRPLILPALAELHQTYPSYPIHLVGHSLGGAIAALAGLELQARGWEPRVTTFGEPMIGNAALAAVLDEMFHLSQEPDHDEYNPRYRRITHISDPVPLLPLAEWGYAPHSGELFIGKPDLQPGPADVRPCAGPTDARCITGSDAMARYRLWQLLGAHRDYFWRLGLCVPGGDPGGTGLGHVAGGRDEYWRARAIVDAEGWMRQS